MRLKILALALFASSCLSCLGDTNTWGDYWPITQTNIGTSYGHAINDLLCANVERYKMNIADINNNRWHWNPIISWPSSAIQIQRDILLPVVIDLGGYTVTSSVNYGVTNIIVTENVTNSFVTNDVTTGNNATPMVLNYWSAGVQDLPHYGLKAFDFQFVNLIEYQTGNYYGGYEDRAAYWLDWTKADTNGLY